MTASRKVSDLLPVVAKRCLAFVAKAQAEGIEVIITSTYRDFASQNALYAQGRTRPGKVVTRARGGQSYHNFRVAFDFVPVVHGKAVWTDLALFRRCGEIGESLGLEWGGRWQGMRDRPHMQYTGGLSLAEMRAGELPK